MDKRLIVLAAIAAGTLALGFTGAFEWADLAPFLKTLATEAME